MAARFFPRSLSRAIFEELFHHAFGGARIGQHLPLPIGFLPRAFLFRLGRGAIIQRLLDKGTKLRVQPFRTFLPQRLFGSMQGLFCRGFGGQPFGQGAAFRLGFQAAELLQGRQRVLGHDAVGKA